MSALKGRFHHLWTRAGLRFADGRLEDAFRDSVEKRFGWLVPAGMALGALTFASYGVWDTFIGQGAESIVQMRFRFLIATPIMLLFAILTYATALKRFTQTMIVLYGLTTDVLALHQLGLYDPRLPVGISSGAGALNFALIMIFGVTVFPMYALTGAAFCLTTFAIYCGALYASTQMTVVHASSLLFPLFQVVLISILACYARERLGRSEFAQARAPGRRLLQGVFAPLPSITSDHQHSPELQAAQSARKIIISYRRADSEAIVGRLHDYLVDYFGHDAIFMDIDSIPVSTDFRHQIGVALQGANVLLAIVGPSWLGPVRNGTARIHSDADPVRVEIEGAIRQGIPIVPVLVGNAEMPTVAELPDSLSQFAFTNATTLDAGRDFQAHIRRLVRAIAEIVDAGR
jgi:hypothetical protein